jgi:hypothetical protein
VRLTGLSDPEFESVLDSLAGPRIGLSAALPTLPTAPGLYAVYAGADVWIALGLGEQPDGRPLYVGKSESSLQGRDVDTHFGDGQTGWSTVRRSFAALLHAELGLGGPEPSGQGSTKILIWKVGKTDVTESLQEVLS